MSGDARLTVAVITGPLGGVLTIIGPADLVLELADPYRYRGLDGFMLAMEEDRLYRLRNPGLLGRHWRMLAVWGIALALGWQAGLHMLVRIAMAAELCVQHGQSRQYYKQDWRARLIWGPIAGFFMFQATLSGLVRLPVGDWARQALWTVPYCLGQWMLSNALHRMAYKYAKNGRMSTRGWYKRLVRAGIGLLVMVWSVYFAL